MSIEQIKTLGLRSLGILLVLAGAALLVPSLGATEKRSKPREQEVAFQAREAPCPHPESRLDECRRAARTP